MAIVLTNCTNCLYCMVGPEGDDYVATCLDHRYSAPVWDASKHMCNKYCLMSDNLTDGETLLLAKMLSTPNYTQRLLNTQKTE